MLGESNNVCAAGLAPTERDIIESMNNAGLPGPKTLIVMPAWNESESITATIKEIISEGYEVLVVNDGSEDDTSAIAKNAGAQLLDMPFNLGVGGAMRAGFKYARRHGYAQVIQVDADGQHNPNDIARVLSGLDIADISIGARFAGRGNYTVRGPRYWVMTLLAKAVSCLAKTKLTDVTSGFRAANIKAINQYIEHYPVEYLGDTLDSLVMALRSGLTVTQVPVAMRPRRGGTPSHNPLKAALYLGRSIFALLFAITRRKQEAFSSASDAQGQPHA